MFNNSSHKMTSNKVPTITSPTNIPQRNYHCNCIIAIFHFCLRTKFLRRNIYIIEFYTTGFFFILPKCHHIKSLILVMSIFDKTSPNSSDVHADRQHIPTLISCKPAKRCINVRLALAISEWRALDSTSQPWQLKNTATIIHSTRGALNHRNTWHVRDASWSSRTWQGDVTCNY